MKLRSHSRTKAPPPALPIPRLRRPCVNHLRKLVSRKWIRFIFYLLVNVHDLSFSLLFFIKQKTKNCPFLFVCFLFSEKMEKLFGTLVIFFIFLIKMELWKIGRQVCYFSIFSFFEHNGKNEKMVRINIIFFIFLFFYFLGKTEKQKNELGIGHYFIFLIF